MSRKRKRSPEKSGAKAAPESMVEHTDVRGGAPKADDPGASPRLGASERERELPPHPEELCHDPLVESAWNEYWRPYIEAGGDPADAPPEAVNRFWSEAFPAITRDPDLVPIARQAWREVAERQRHSHAAAEMSLVARIEEIWGEALRLLDELIKAADLLLQFNEWRARLRANADPPEWTVRAQLVLLARAIQTAHEVRVLLRSGYAAGALGRWRTLHEISVVARFIDSCGDAVAEPYLNHDEMQTLRVMQAYDRYSATWATHEGTKESKEVQEERVRSLAARFGPLFKTDYGWAVAGFPQRDFRYPGPSLGDLEEAVNLSLARPAYTKANHVIHASVRGFTDNPGHEVWPAKRLLAGPSVHGLDEPGFWTARSLLTAAVSSAGRWPLPSQVVHLSAMVSLNDDAADAFFEAKQRLPSPLAGLASNRNQADTRLDVDQS